MKHAGRLPMAVFSAVLLLCSKAWVEECRLELLVYKLSGVLVAIFY